MELGLLFQLFGADIWTTSDIRKRVQLVVLEDKDVGDGTDKELIANAIADKVNKRE